MTTDHVYLAGPITGLSYDAGQDWRVALTALFAEHGIVARSPLRGKGYLKTLGVLEDQYHGLHPLSETAGIVTRDRNDCMTAGVVLANLLGAERVSIGTVMECAWADASRVPLILVVEEGNVHRHGMMTQVAGYVTDSLAVAVDITRTILGQDLDVPHV